jgi:hypothetical protein
MLNVAGCIGEWKGHGRIQVIGATVKGRAALIRSPRKPTRKTYEISAMAILRLQNTVHII